MTEERSTHPEEQEKKPRPWRPTYRQVFWAIGMVVTLMTIALLVVQLYPGLWEDLSKEPVALLKGRVVTLIVIGIGVALTVLIVLLAMGSASLGWTGFRGKTLWDLLQVLIVPLVLVGIGLVFEMQQTAREERRADVERELAEQRAQDDALQVYLDQMGDLLLAKDGLRESEEGSEVRTLARARTITVLGRLDPKRKTAVMQFLDEADLIQRVDGGAPIISLRGADLREANMSETYLGGAYLSEANLSEADLSEAHLSYADLLGANMSGADFDPALSFTLNINDGWQPSHEVSGAETAATLRIEGSEGGQLIFTNPSHVFDPSNLSEAKELPAPENPEGWVSWFQSHPNLDTSKPLPASVGGASGKQIDVTASSTSENYPRDLCGGQPCVPLYPTSAGGISSSEGWKDRFVIVDVGGQKVVIDVAAPAYKFDEFLPKAQKVLDTVEWKGG